jgi:hypothetical protein
VVTSRTPDGASAFGVKRWSGLANTCDPAPVFSAAKTLLRVPFDAMREHYASAVRAGLIERSQIASASFERKLVALERATLGPWARRV